MGEAIVSGQITPDSYVITKDKMEIIEKNVNVQTKGMYRNKKDSGNEWKDTGEIGKQQKLSESEIIELSRLIIKIEKHYGFPVDVEWAREKGKFYIVQSRPITTLSVTDNKNKFRHEFKLDYVRDRQIITQEAWVYGNSLGIEKLMDFKLKNNLPMILYYHNGPVEIWQDNSVIQEAKEKILEINKKDRKYIDKIINRFNSELNNFFIPIWNKGFTKDKDELKNIGMKFKEMVPYYVYIYNTLLTEETPNDIKEKSKEWKERDVFFENTGRFIEKSLEKIYTDLGRLVQVIKLDEIKNPPKKDILEKRKKNFIYVPGYFNETIPLDEFQEKHKDFKFIVKDVVKSDELIGEVANKGYARGKVKLLRVREEMDKVMEGDIIVSPMTIPEFLPAMKKAAAFVTDEGGIMSHAAVVAREIGKPCITGTKFATQILHDGDLVEVDADKGIVRILEKANI